MSDSPIEHVVVLMMENHSYDHTLGYFPPPIGTLASMPQCLPNPGTSNSQPPQYCTTVWKDKWSIDPCPIHSHANVMQQIYGPGNFGQQPPWPDPAPMNGFLADYFAGLNYSFSYPQGQPQGAGNPADLMGSFALDSLPTLASLARTYTVCTNWFCSVPGPTGPNRLFANCASSGGYAGAAYENMPSQLASLPSVFGNIKRPLTWQIYHQDPEFATELVLKVVQNQPSAIPADPCFRQFQKDALAGNLANYVFLTPTLPNSQHDSWDARAGDAVMNCVYSTLFESPLWESTLLLITYDEHGGHYDHVPPPLSYTNDAGQSVTIQNPDDLLWNADTWGTHFVEPEFDFTCLGARVPAIIVSAYTQPGVDATLYEHASISATLNELFGIGTLTRRDASASSFLKNVNPSAKRQADSLMRPLLPVIKKP